ncbi:MAG: secondary thiamine-phosphate synthase enzyme YjbQ [Bacteroidota bacterium]|nr:secondary thiamine-phosphate synthase enzyme YjbQ [Bacteroidota bacterium]MDX5506267.1 secondary thiamine-phosphate synthase enzyme YjbQ [Bacteroidota bacterium]
MNFQTTIILAPRKRGIHLITNEVVERLPELQGLGLLHLFIQNTSAGICINENADPSVRRDMSYFFDKTIPEDDPGYTHTLEGPDDMPAHIKAVTMGCEITLPIRQGRLALGTWQGIYLGEFRNRGGARRMVATIMDLGQ